VAVAAHFDKQLVNPVSGGTLVTMRRLADAEWEPTVPALVNLVAASGAPRLRAAFEAAGLDGIRPAQAIALVPLVAGGLHASDLADRLRVSRQAVAQAVAPLERHGYVTRVTDPVDARARIIELTPRGRRALRVMRASAIDLETRWEKILGRKRLGELRETLQVLLSSESSEADGVGSTPSQ
jgi:DNA-binding MarR family transcriptional regulator